ncbi:hypothetical protein C8J56DRAFT_1021521 [Mycena floridula]|nr:hypothetical protein C8J56DRAFT_1021521 [Mycena floridula]
MSPMPRRKGPPNALRIDMPQNPQIALALSDSPASALSSAASESDYSSPFNAPTKPRSLRNMKNLSLGISSTQSSTTSLAIPSEPPSATSSVHPELPFSQRLRRPSVISLPATNTPSATALLFRKEEQGSPTIPYADGPIQIIPSIWLGSEDNARDWKGLVERGIKSILNVAKEVSSPFDSAPAAHPLRSTVSTPNLQQTQNADPTYYPPNLASGRPGMHYLKLQWSHGQQDLVANGFQAGMAFTDAAIERGEGVLIHCQCGISRSATMVIALVMRAAAERSPSVPSEIWALKGMQGAYNFAKEKSKWVGPNMSLIYQLLDYERKLGGDGGSPSRSERSSAADEDEEEWGRRRKMMDEEPSDKEEDDRESAVVMEEAKALDEAMARRMEDRVVARKTSASSVSSGVGMGAAWRSRYGSRKRTGSIASNMSKGSILSEDLIEAEEEPELLGALGGLESGGFESDRPRSADLASVTDSPDDNSPGYTARPQTLSLGTPRQLLRPPPSAPIWRTSFSIPPPPASATRATFDLSSRPLVKSQRRRPVALGFLPPVPSSPIHIVVDVEESDSSCSSSSSSIIEKPKEPLQRHHAVPLRVRTESRKPAPPPLHLRGSILKKANQQSNSVVSTPSQTLFVFPPSPTLTTRTPSTMTLSNLATPVAFPSLSTPRISTFRSQGGRTRSFIGLGAPPTPTTAFSKVDVRGYVGLE